VSLSVLDLFTIGIGPSSSHTVGPMRAARRFVERLREAALLERTTRVEAHLYGSLALTGKGHGTDTAVLLGLEGETPEEVDVDAVPSREQAIRSSETLRLGGTHPVPFVEKRDLLFHRTESLPAHPNGLRFTARDARDSVLLIKTYFSIGGGFVVSEQAAQRDELSPPDRTLPHPWRNGADLLAQCARTGLGISELTLQNETAFRPEAETRAALLRVWAAMQACVERGCRHEGALPGGLKVPRRAPKLLRELSAHPEAALQDPLTALDWVSLWAIAVNEENAGGGRVVTAPTNGAAGILPAVLHYFVRIHRGSSDDSVVRFLVTAGTIGMLYKLNASISGAEVGCQGEVGVACSMAAGALCEALGGTPAQVENAAEIGMEHNLGLTCDPIGGLVQIPCIERNAMGAVKAINAARLALRGDGRHTVSLDKVIATMRQTGADMSTKYKETSRGGLAVNVTEC
jgi:L-serine dehydratase